METLNSPLTLAKINLPALPVRFISRPRLLDRLSLAPEQKVILVCAPAGYGKTSLLSHWGHELKKNGAAVAWYALEASDDDSRPFGVHLTASLIEALGPQPELVQILQLQRSSPELDLLRVVQLLVNALMGIQGRCVLVLDDYHLIQSQAVHQALSFFIAHLPENVYLAIGTRHDPPLALGRLRARNKLLETRSEMLRFTLEETDQFLNVLLVQHLTPESLAVLERRTEGWAAGLQLAAISLANQKEPGKFISGFSGSHPYLVEYWLEEIFNQQPQNVQKFLVDCSVVERLGAPLCEALMGESGQSAGILETLYQHNLFILPLDESHTWFRFHPLFREFLLNRLNKTQTERLPELHRRASAWFVTQGYYREAVQHAFLTQDWECAADCVEQVSFNLIIQSDISTIYEWCSAFPERVILNRPMLAILQCWGWVMTFRKANRLKIDSRLGVAESIAARLEDPLKKRELLEHAAVVRTFLAMAPDLAFDPTAQFRQAEILLENFDYPEGDAGQFSALLFQGYALMAMHDTPTAQQILEKARLVAQRGRLLFGIIESSFHLARLAHVQGNINQAIRICRETQAEITALVGTSGSEPPALGCLNIALGCIFYEQAHWAEAEKEIRLGLSLIGFGMNPYYVLIANTVLFRMCVRQGRLAEAAAILDSSEDCWPDIRFYSQALRYQLALNARAKSISLAQVTAWRRNDLGLRDDTILKPGMGPLGAAEVYYLSGLAWFRLQIAVGQVQDIWPSLEEQIRLAVQYGQAQRFVELSVLEAAAAKIEGDTERASQALGRALLTGQPEGLVSGFDQGLELRDLLTKAAGQDEYREYIGKILAASGLSGSDIPQPTAVLPEPLSRRENEILRLIALGASNQDIADQLYITLGTAKSHINHILGKLGAANRTEAVALARKVGLL
jgi:LuxR family maltose regulon positive regulatory protein